MSARATKRGMLVLGLMSGTSADGIDIALANISGAPPRVKARLVNHTAVKFPAQVRAEILRVAEQRAITARELSQLNFRLGQLFAEAAKAACERFGVRMASVDLIGSHGQTIFHQGSAVPYLGGRVASTLQIGEAAVIAAQTGVTAVADFRPADMAAGGQGAPLVPYADYLLYSDGKLGRASLNLGGIANVTVIPAGAARERVFALDTGPANMLIDALVAHFTRGRKKFDAGAKMALAGRAIPALLDELMRDPYLKKAPPRSTGREYYGGAYVKRVLALGRRFRAKPNDLIRSVTIFTALSVVDALNRFVTPKTKLDQLIVSGGGARNPLIMAQLAAALAGVEVLPSSRLGVPEEAKEAFAFALLAYETFHQRAGNVSPATGASGPVILGKVSYAGAR
ncbi:MAG TPA: anhydro-N-acetylmuramic acid kinase [Candidatus Acidoferrales bacterium]|nr:anhydro-N-acetylmuramic acid kinase [Candidatus Acidoferrales bacterium]